MKGLMLYLTSWFSWNILLPCFLLEQVFQVGSVGWGSSSELWYIINLLLLKVAYQWGFLLDAICDTDCLRVKENFWKFDGNCGQIYWNFLKCGKNFRKHVDTYVVVCFVKFRKNFSRSCRFVDYKKYLI